MKISIVMAYYNRKNLFYRTLKSIVKTKHKDFEVIAVDDASMESERIEDLTVEFPFLKVIRVEPEDKWYNSSTIPCNIGIAAADCDIIVLQNPECLHVHDVLDYIAIEVNSTNYVAISTYCIDKKLTEDLPLQMNETDFITYFKALPQQMVYHYIGWYNHSKHRPVYYPFCGVMTKKNMDALGGLDERYAMGIGFEDNDLVDRIGKSGLHKIISDNVSVIHQWHPLVFDLSKNPEYVKLYKNNGSLFDMTKNEKTYKINNSFNRKK